MAPKRANATIASSKTRAAGKAKASPKSKGRKPAAKSLAAPKAAPRTPAPRTPVPKTPKVNEVELERKKGRTTPLTPASFQDVEAEVLLRSSYATKEAQLQEALRKAQDLEAMARAERSRALEAEKRAAAAEAYLQELRARASRAEALQLEVGQAQARAAHAEAKAEVLSELQESFQRNIPEMVRSIAQTMVDCSTGRRSRQRSLACNGHASASFRGVKPKLELEDGADMPHLMVGVSEDMNGAKFSEDRLKFHGEEIPSSADTKSDSQDRGRSQASRLPYGLPCVLKGAVRSG